MIKKKHKTTNYEFPDISTSGHYIPMSAQKARRVIDLIREIPYEDALTILEFIPYRASYPILKLISSAAEKAAKLHDKDELIISGIEVNEGPTKKKLKPQAQGRSCLIKRSTCHITVRFNNINDNAPFHRLIFIIQLLREILRRMRELEIKIRKTKREIRWSQMKGERRQRESERLSKKLKGKCISMDGREGG